MQRVGIRHAVETTLADLRNALRHLRRAPLLASLTILTLGLGIGATTAIFSLVNAMLLEDLPFRDGEQLLFVGHDLTGGRLGACRSPPRSCTICASARRRSQVSVGSGRTPR